MKNSTIGIVLKYRENVSRIYRCPRSVQNSRASWAALRAVRDPQAYRRAAATVARGGAPSGTRSDAAAGGWWPYTKIKSLEDTKIN